MALIDSLIVFSVSLIIGALGLHLAAEFVVGESDFRTAIVAALVGSLAWSVAGFLFGGVPLLGPFIALIAWIWIINGFYKGGWVDAALIGLTAWITVSVVLYLLAAADFTAFEAVGVPEQIM